MSNLAFLRQCGFCQLNKHLNYTGSRFSSRHVKPTFVSPTLKVPSHIRAPQYSLPKQRRIDIKTPESIAKMRECCQLASKVLRTAGELVEVGITTDELDKSIHDIIIAHDAYPSPLLYRGFPKSICTSVNNVAIHGIPDSRQLQDGDIITVDITVFYKEHHGDCCATFEVGRVDDKGRALIEATRKCRDEAIKVCGPGVPLSVIGKTISALSKSLGYKVVPNICGHGIGHYFHGPPEILHCDNNLSVEMKSGMTFTIEPVLTESTESVTTLKDGWTVVTSDHCRSAQFEHTVLITDTGAEILTS